MIINIRGQVLSLSAPVCEAEQERERDNTQQLGYNSYKFKNK
jgi:hypothetical protein